MPRVWPLRMCSLAPVLARQTMMQASAPPEMRRSLSSRSDDAVSSEAGDSQGARTQMTALTKSACPKYRRPGARVDVFHDQMDLSQQPAYSVRDVVEKARLVRGAAGPRKMCAVSLVWVLL